MPYFGFAPLLLASWSLLFVGDTFESPVFILSLITGGLPPTES